MMYSLMYSLLILTCTCLIVNCQQLITNIDYFGLDKIPILTLDNVLPKILYQSIRDDLRNSVHFVEGHERMIAFPGKILTLDRVIVDAIIKGILSSKTLDQFYPPSMFKKDTVTGFASILCHDGYIHNDHLSLSSKEIVSPAAVFYFGFDGIQPTPNINSKKKTGTAFYREKESGLERITSIVDHLKFCATYPNSIGCVGEENNEEKKDVVFLDLEEHQEQEKCFLPLSHNDQVKDKVQFEEMYRVQGIPNRLVIYPKDVLHKGWVENGNNESDTNYPCSPTTGRLAISLFFSLDEEYNYDDEIIPSSEINEIDATWNG